MFDIVECGFCTIQLWARDLLIADYVLCGHTEFTNYVLHFIAQSSLPTNVASVLTPDTFPATS